MRLNFFDALCQEPPLSDENFGLCDDQDGKKAYINKDDKSKWIAEVKNEHNINLVFSAIDKCVLQDNRFKNYGRCDAMIFSNDHLYFIELKNENKKWIKNALDQLEGTIKLFLQNHDINNYRHKKAFACNRQRRPFQVIDQETKIKFFRKYRFRLDIQSNVVVV